MGRRLEAAVHATGGVTVGRILNRYPNAIDLVRALRAHAPEIVFLSFESPDKAQEVVKFLETEGNGIQIVAIHHTCDAKTLRDTMRLGVRELLCDPFELHAVCESLAQVKVLIERRP